MSVSSVIVVAVGAAAGGFVQGLSGFAFGLVAMSVWVWSLDPQLAAPLAIFGALTGQIMSVITVRRRICWRDLLPFILGGLIGIPVGAALLPVLDVNRFKAFLGALLVLWCPIMFFATRLPRISRGGPMADGVVGLLGGVMSGLGGFAGVFPNLWCVLRGFDKDHQRGLVQNFNLTILSVTMVTYAFSGTITATDLPMFAVVAPAMVVPSVIGARLYMGMSEVAFRKIVLGLLTVSGAASLASAIPWLIAWGR
ncbi:sulfite exporter TauE/SafE family protein [Paraburkholderia sp. MM5477-R1]|uniref:sulfite exporter TauE/SafE family protein n=1 Tax=Paraburkholderia sp. MM5477-R1 TaxID=2991062 RepID=UPI003D1C89F0